MKKNFSLNSLLLAGFIVVPGLALANNPINYNITVACPGTQGTQNNLTNFGDYIAGYGVEYILGQTVQVYFMSGSISGIPANISNYYNSTVGYDSKTGMVSCSYQSNNGTDPAFTVSYNLTNGLGGTIQAQSNNYITINVEAGLRG